MDELEKGLTISLSAHQAKPYLDAFFSQIDDWKIALPPVEPLVLDFGLGRFLQTGLIEYWIANEIDAGYCGKYLFLFDAQTCPEHRHRVKVETFFIVKGNLVVSIAGKHRILKEGHVLLVEPGQLHSMTGIGSCLFLELSKPCLIDDNEFSDNQIPIGKTARDK